MIQEPCMTAATAVLHAMYVLKGEGCCNHVSDLPARYGEGAGEIRTNEESDRDCGGERLLHKLIATTARASAKHQREKSSTQRKHLSPSPNCSLLPSLPAQGFSLAGAIRGAGGSALPDGAAEGTPCPPKPAPVLPGAASRTGAVLDASAPGPPLRSEPLHAPAPSCPPGS